MAAANNSLNLLQSYESSDSDDDTDSAQKIAKKRTSDDQSTCGNNKKLCSERKLPLPQALTSMYLENKYDVDRVDDPDAHEGRLRSFPHQRGQWSTLVYIPFEPEIEQWTTLEKCLRTWKFDDTTLNLFPDLHISLSRTVTLRHHWMESFIQDIKKSFLQIPRFQVYLSGLKVFTNDEKTRTFLAIPVVSGVQELLKMSKITDSALAEFKLPPFYEEASFHVSIAWCLGDKSEVLNISLPSLLSTLDQLGVPECWPLTVDQVECRMGNRITNIFLSV